MLEILLTIDIDADVFDNSFKKKYESNQIPSWEGLKIGVPQIIELFDCYKGSDGSDCIATWFVRADDQIGYYFGNNSYIFSKFHKNWKILFEKGHEIAWHPHLYKLDNDIWPQEYNSSALKEQLYRSKISIQMAGWEVKSSRIGEAYCSNSIINDLSELGIKVDSSALPGRSRKDGERTIDWINSPFKPYYPSKADYRIPGSPSYPILEIPFSMALIKADYDTVPIYRYVDLSFWHRSMKDGLKNIINDNSILNTIIHPSTVLPELSSKPHGLLSFDIMEVKKNLDFIINTATDRGIEFTFKTISKIKI